MKFYTFIPTFGNKNPDTRYFVHLDNEQKKELMEKAVNEKKQHSVLFETYKNGILCGHAEDFTEVFMHGDEALKGKIIAVRADSIIDGKLFCVMMSAN